jgi:hypothetical protein
MFRRILHVVLPLFCAVVGVWLSYMAAFVWPEYYRSTGCPNGEATCQQVFTRASGGSLIIIFVASLIVTAFFVFAAWAITHEGA